MKRALITGSNGFIGKNLIARLRKLDSLEIQTFDTEDNLDTLEEYLKVSDIVFHLAGVNRPEKIEEFKSGNTGLTRIIIDKLEKLKRNIPVVFSSSIQAALDNPYGISKKLAEDILIEYSRRNCANVYIYRFPNVFGKWCRPNYNSVVATFCYNISRNLPISISDGHTKLALIYIDDVIDAFLKEIEPSNTSGFFYKEALPVYTITLEELARELKAFKSFRANLVSPDFSDAFVRKLYATYLSYLDPKDLSYALEKRTDNRGYLGEFLKSSGFGQIFVSNTSPGIMRGNHYHNVKTEKFLVVEGEGVIALRNICCSNVIEYEVKGSDLRVVDIPPGYAHSIKNTGSGNLVTLFWSSQVFDPNNADTYPMDVVLAKDERNGV